ncbi:hypothetical protein Tco_1436944 [Tanacetum coccineum]
MTVINANVLSNFVSLQCLSSLLNALLQNTMAEQNVPAQPPTRTDEQIVPRSQWLTIGKSNLLFNAQKIQKNPIFQISVDILSNTNFSSIHCLCKCSCYLPATVLENNKGIRIIPSTSSTFELPPSGNTVIDFVNELGYPEPVEIVSNIRSLLKDPDIFLTQGKAKSQSEEPKEEELISSSLWTVFQGIYSFVPKVSHVEVFGYAIPDPLITEAIQQSSYYPKYLEMVAENTKKTPQESASVQPATKRDTPKKPTTTTPVKQSKPAPPPSKKSSKRKLPQKVRKGKPAFQLVDEDDEAQQESIPQGEDDDPDLDLAKKLSLEAHQEKGEEEGNDADLERAIKLSLDPAFLPQGRAPVGGVTIRDPVSEATPKLHEVVGKGKAVVTEEQVAHSLIDLSKKKRTTDQFILVRRDQTPPDSTTGPSSQPDDDTSEKVIHESSSTSDSERTESETEVAAPKGDKDQDEVDTSTVTSGVSIPVSDPEKAHEALAGPDPEPMKEDQTGSDSGQLHVSLAGPNPEHMDDDFLATAYPKVHENLKLITDERVIDDKPESQSGSMSSMKNLDDTFNFGDQFLYDKPTEDDQEKSKPSSLVTPPPINTRKKSTTIQQSLPEITPFIALQLRVARLEQEMSEVKKTDHQADVLASIKSQVPTAVDKYLGTKLDDALLKILERHTADLIEKYSVLPGLESVKNQESEKSPKEIIRAKKEQDEEKQDSTYSIRSTDKVDLEEFDLKSALFNHMNKKKSANRNTANYHLYHALMEALIADEDAMDKEVADKVKDHKRKHDSDDDEDDDDDEGPSAGSNQGRSTKKRRSDSAASGSAKPPPKDDDQSSKKPRETEASASKQHPALTSTGWQITDTRVAGVNSSGARLDPESEHSDHLQLTFSMQDEGMTQIWRTLTTLTFPRCRPLHGLSRFQKARDLLHLNQNGPFPRMIPRPRKHNWANTYATTYKVPEENKLQRKMYDIGSFIKWFCDKARKIALSISKLKATRYLDFGLEELVPSLWVESERDLTSGGLWHHSLVFRGGIHRSTKHSESWIVKQIMCRDLQLRMKVIKQGYLESHNWDAATITSKKGLYDIPKPKAVVYSDRNAQRK